MNAIYDQVAQDLPKTQSILESQSRGFENRAEDIIKLTSRLNEIANRTFGHEVAEISNNKPTAVPVPGFTLGRLTDSGEQLDKAISGLSRAITRFDSL